MLSSGCGNRKPPKDRFIVNWKVPDPQPEEIDLKPYPECANEKNSDLIECEIKRENWTCATLKQLDVYVKRSSKHPQTSEFERIGNMPEECLEASR
jgi:hypothetical protein